MSLCGGRGCRAVFGGKVSVDVRDRMRSIVPPSPLDICRLVSPSRPLVLTHILSSLCT